MKNSAKIIAFPVKLLSSENAETQPVSYVNTSTAPENTEQPVEIDSTSGSPSPDAPSAEMITGTEIILTRPKREARLDGLTDEQFERYAENRLLIVLMEGEEKLTPAAAIKRTGFNRSPRAVAKLYQRYQTEGKHALFDRRWFRQTEATVLTDSTKDLIMNLVMAYPVGPRGIRRSIKRQIERLNKSKNPEDAAKAASLKLPAVATLHKYIDNLPEAVKKVRTERGFSEYKKQGAPYKRFENTTNANERWQLDHSWLKIWIRVFRNGKWKAFRVYLTLALDVHSRAIVGYWISTKYPDTWAIKIMLYFAILPKRIAGCRVCGRPHIIQCDNGADYISKAMRVSTHALGIRTEVDPAYYPNSKGKIERVFRTIDTMGIQLLPGHIKDIGVSQESADKRVAELLTREYLQKELDRIILEYNNTVHGETERKPQELWEETVIGPILPEEHELNTLLLQYDKVRTIQGWGINLKFDGDKHLYWHPIFVHHWREKVTIGYNPESMDSVRLYDSVGNFICEAWDLRAKNPRFTLKDITAARKNHLAGLRDLKQRGKEYMEEVWRDDRRVEQRKNYEVIREEIKNKKDDKKSEIAAKNAKENAEADAILKLFHQQDTKK